MILYIMNDFAVGKEMLEYVRLSDEVIAEALKLLQPKEVGDMLQFRGEKFVLDEIDMIPILRLLDELSTDLKWHYHQREADAYFQVYVTPLTP